MSTSPSVNQGLFEPPPNNLPGEERAHPSSSEPTLYPQLILFGDSITQFGTLTLQPYLQTQYIRRLDVINRGFSGYTAPMGLDVLPKILPLPSPRHQDCAKPSVKVMTIFFGANDAALPPHPQSVALPDYVEALSKIINYPLFQEPQHSTKLILITPPPIDEYQLEPSNPRRACSAAAYALAASQLTQALQIPCLDLWTIYMHRAGWTEDMGRDCCKFTRNDRPRNAGSSVTHIPGCSLAPPSPVLASLLSDGLHLTTMGYDVLFDEMMDLIRKDIPGYAPENLPYVLVEWRTALGVA